MKYQVLPRPETGAWGLYAAEDIMQGEKILGLPSETIPHADKYSLQVGEVHVDCGQSPIACLNHSCQPNAAVRGWAVIAFSCVKKGEEITIDYRRTESKLAAPFKCACGHCEGDLIE